MLVCTLLDEQLSFCRNTAPRWKRRLFNLLNYKRSTEPWYGYFNGADSEGQGPRVQQDAEQRLCAT